jgi:Mg2+/Co2+ transporter CorC
MIKEQDQRYPDMQLPDNYKSWFELYKEALKVIHNEPKDLQIIKIMRQNHQAQMIENKTFLFRDIRLKTFDELIEQLKLLPDNNSIEKLFTLVDPGKFCNSTDAEYVNNIVKNLFTLSKFKTL